MHAGFAGSSQGDDLPKQSRPLVKGSKHAASSHKRHLRGEWEVLCLTKLVFHAVFSQVKTSFVFQTRNASCVLISQLLYVGSPDESPKTGNVRYLVH